MRTSHALSAGGWWQAYLPWITSNLLCTTLSCTTLPSRLALVAILVATQPAMLLAQPDEPESVLIFVSPTPPVGYSFERWNEACFDACSAWLLDAGCSISATEDPTRAEIAFTTKEFRQHRYAECHYTVYRPFPALPSINFPISIEVNHQILKLPQGNLLRTLKHEVGHALGLTHDPESVVSASRHRHPDLTSKDRRHVRHLRKHLRHILLLD